MLGIFFCQLPDTFSGEAPPHLKQWDQLLIWEKYNQYTTEYPQSLET